jgi:hypothetical protein
MVCKQADETFLSRRDLSSKCDHEGRCDLEPYCMRRKRLPLSGRVLVPLRGTNSSERLKGSCNSSARKRNYEVNVLRDKRGIIPYMTNCHGTPERREAGHANNQTRCALERDCCKLGVTY